MANSLKTDAKVCWYELRHIAECCAGMSGQMHQPYGALLFLHSYDYLPDEFISQFPFIFFLHLFWKWPLEMSYPWMRCHSCHTLTVKALKVAQSTEPRPSHLIISWSTTGHLSEGARFLYAFCMTPVPWGCSFLYLLLCGLRDGLGCRKLLHSPFAAFLC